MRLYDLDRFLNCFCHGTWQESKQNLIHSALEVLILIGGKLLLNTLNINLIGIEIKLQNYTCHHQFTAISILKRGEAQLQVTCRRLAHKENLNPRIACV